MPRPPMPLGTYGKIRTYRTGDNWMARTLYRDYDGVTRYVQKHARTEASAQRALVEALRDRHRSDSGASITPDMRVDALAEAWWAEIEGASHSPGTLRNYRDRLDRQVIPTLGNLRVRELTPGVVDRHLRAVKEKNGAGTAKLTRTVLSGVCGLAVRHDALDRNPVRDASAIKRTAPKREAVALTLAQARQLRAALTYDDRAVRRDIPDLVSFMLATGLRIGQACAVRWGGVDLEAGVVRSAGVVVRVRGEGLRIKTDDSTKARELLLRLPSWAVEMLRQRLAAADDSSPEAPVFTAPMGGLRDPSNTQADMSEAFDDVGFGWVTSHVFRKTVATLMEKAGLTSRAAADQLGHRKVSMTQDSYFGRHIEDTGAADVLEALGD